MTGVFLDETLMYFAIVNLQETGNKLDLAIEGNGFFTVEGNGQQLLSRDGVFTVDSQGYIVNSSGYYLMGESGRINAGNGDVEVTTEGTVLQNNQVLDNLLITVVNNPHSLEKVGLNLFAATGNTQIGGAQGLVRQGFLEGSNVDLAEEMVELISTMRAYETNQKMIQTLDETLGKAVNEIASVR